MSRWLKRNNITTLAHFLGGLLTLFSILIHPVVPFILLFAFVIYELWEDKEIHDEGYKDLWAYMLGAYVADFILLLKISMEMIR